MIGTSDEKKQFSLQLPRYFLYPLEPFLKNVQKLEYPFRNNCITLYKKQKRRQKKKFFFTFLCVSMYLLMYLACTSKQRTWKKCDKTMKSTLFIRAPVIASRLSHAAFRRRAKRDMIAKSFQYIPQNAKLSTLFNRIECSPSARIFKYS